MKQAAVAADRNKIHAASCQVIVQTLGGAPHRALSAAKVAIETVNFKTLFIGSGRIEIRATRKTGCATAVTGGPAVSLAQTCSYNCGRARGSALKDRSTLRNIKLLV
jgi:hypothetical protein